MNESMKVREAFEDLRKKDVDMRIGLIGSE
jgi:hypothetical protein